MNAERLLEHFDRLCEAPDAIPRLRKFVLELAVRGKLTETTVTDGHARELFERARPDDESDSPDNVVGPYELPNQWLWVQVGEILEMINGRAFKPTDWQNVGLPIVRIQNLNNAHAPFNYCAPEGIEDRHRIDDGCFLISWSGTPGTSFGAFIWNRGKAALNQHIFKCRQIGEAYTDRFLQLAINGRLDEMIAKAHGGVGLQHITKGKLERLAIALPPLAAQRRIVAKVDELMALCDRLEAAQAERERRRDRLAAASLARLNHPSDDREEFHCHVRFHLDHLGLLAARSEHVLGTRQAILNLAVRGMLSEQNTNDASIHQLLSNSALRDKVVRRRKSAARGSVVLNDIKNDVRVPNSWAVEELKNLVDPANTISYGVLVPGSDTAEGVPFVRAQDLYLSGHPDKPNKSISVDIEKPYARTRLVGGEILLCVVGSIGKLGIVPASWAGGNIARAVARIRQIPEIDRDFLLLVLRSDTTQQFFKDATRTLAQPTLNVGLIEQTKIPVPPPEEQRRIVIKVNELMSICEHLESRLARASADRRRLLDVVLSEALNAQQRASVAGNSQPPLTIVALKFASRFPNWRTGGDRKRIVKSLAIAQRHLGVDFGWFDFQKSAGPHNRALLENIESEATAAGLLEVEPRTGDVGVYYRYKPKPLPTAAAKQLAEHFGDKFDELNRLADLTSTWTSEQAELYATIYAVWNDLLIDKKPVSDAIVVGGVRNWSAEKKGKFSETEIVSAINELRTINLVPRGHGPKTKQSPQMSFSEFDDSN